MLLSEERIRYLLQAYTDHTATEAEEQELFEWVATTTDDTLLREHIRQVMEARTEGIFPAADWEKMYRQVKQEAGITATTPVRRMRWYRIAAAVLVLIAGAGSMYWLFHKKRPVQKETVSAAQYEGQDIQPGNTRAILQAGGQHVTLNKKDTSFTLAGNTVQVNGGSIRVAEARPVQYTLITPRGGQYKLTLPDGTIAWLNADSRLAYPSVFTGDKREVTLQGEAYFEVHTDAARPFIVHAAQQDVQVLGTEFNIQAYPDEANIVTTLVKGKVRINSADKTLLLQPGEQSQLNKQQGQLTLAADADVDEVVAWKNGYFRFDKMDIRSIMQQLSRWYDVDVRYEDDLQPHYFGAIISRDNNISQILHLLEATGDVHFKIEGREVFVMP